MKIRFPSDSRSAWRERFVAIAREVEGHPGTRALASAGLRARARGAAFAKRARVALPAA